MIEIIRNPNFSNWFDIRIFGKLVDNAKTQAKALKIAEKIQQTKGGIIVCEKTSKNEVSI